MLERHMNKLSGVIAMSLELTNERVVPNSYATSQKIIHWAIAAIVCVMIPVGIIMSERAEAGIFDALTNTLYSSHKLGGFIVLWLVALRIILKRHLGVPPPAETLTSLERIASTSVHHLLYILMVLVPLLGWAGVSAYPARDVFGLFSLPQIFPESEIWAKRLFAAHGFAALIMAGIVLAHIGGAFMHLLVKRDSVFWRMWPWQRGSF
jgi:cytochrome b561